MSDSTTADAASLKTFGEQLDATMARLRGAFATQRSYAFEWRRDQLLALKRLLIENDAAIAAAMKQDFNKPYFECAATEQGIVLGEISYALKHLKSWMKPQRVSTPLADQPGRCEIRHDPLGVCLVIGAWNYPINLLLAPLVGAICGGNACVLKPSELPDATAKIVEELIPRYLDPDFFAVVQGGPAQTEALLSRVFDLIFFTGSSKVGKIVMAKAAPHLTPTVLELGGKSPAVILADADLSVAARRIVWGKFMNAGQTCIAPDYILIEKSIQTEFVDLLKKELVAFYGNDPKVSPDYCRIINKANFDRLAALLKHQALAWGGETDAPARYIAPTILTDVSPESPVMTDEIFGPILPLLPIESLEQAIEFIRARPKPLSLYLFSSSAEAKERILYATTAGGVCLNDVVMQMPVPGMPFGGVGPSGMGHYHGRYSFAAFTHAKSVLRKSFLFDIPIRYPPYTKTKLDWLRRLF